MNSFSTDTRPSFQEAQDNQAVNQRKYLLSNRLTSKTQEVNIQAHALLVVESRRRPQSGKTEARGESAGRMYGGGWGGKDARSACEEAAGGAFFLYCSKGDVERAMEVTAARGTAMP